MKEILLTANAVYFLFGATIYVGIMWSLRYFFYPSWTAMTVDSVDDHFIVPTSAATRFFTVVVPLMLVSGLVMIVTEWGEGVAFASVVIAYLGILASTYVGQRYIIPVNRTIEAGVASDEELRPLLERWMTLNSIRWVTTTVMWLATVWYFVARGNFLEAVGS